MTCYGEYRASSGLAPPLFQGPTFLGPPICVHTEILHGDQTKCDECFCRVDNKCWRARDLFAVAILVTLIIGLVNWVELYRYWRRRQQRSSWLESSPISRTVQLRFQYSQRIHGTVHRGTWTDNGSSATILAADIPQPCLYNINLHSFIYSLTIYRRRRYIYAITVTSSLSSSQNMRSTAGQGSESLVHGVETCPKNIVKILDLLVLYIFGPSL